MADALSRGDASSVVLIGCHSFTALEDLPAVANNLTGLQDVLTDPEIWGVPKDRVAVMAQPSSADDVLGVVRQAADSASDTLVVYYAGHGLTDPLNWELYLALSESRKGDVLVHSALRFEYLRRVIRNSGAKKKVVLIDCCFSGRALQAAMDGNATDIVGRAVVEGTYVIAAAGPTALALAKPGEQFTAFTGELLGTLKEGVPGAGELLGMEALFGRMRERLLAASGPLPERMNLNTAGQICIARNRALPPKLTGPRPSGVGPAIAASQVRIYSAADDVIGSGFLVAADVVCTCAHVVASALRLEPDTTRGVHDERVELDFPLLDGSPRTGARVMTWRRDGEDVALLRLDAPVDGSWPAPLVDATGAWGHACSVLGFPTTAAYGRWATGTLRGHQAHGWLQMDTSSEVHRIGQGFGGAPVWDRELSAVVGMALAAHDGERTAFLLPSARLVEEQMLHSRSPFPGLAPFMEDDTELLHGRDADIRRVHAAVCGRPVTLVSGPTGCGKSSLVRAGVLPRLRAEGMSVSELRPAPRMSAAMSLATALTGILEPELDVRDRLAKAEELGRLLETGVDAHAELRGRILARGGGAGHVLLIDPLDDYVDADPAAARDLFALVAAVSGEDGTSVLRVLATGRPDSLGALVTPAATDLVGNAVELLAPLAVDDLKRVISAQTGDVPGLQFEPGLLERVVADAGDEPGFMPLVQIVLNGLWQNRTRSTLTHAAYDSFGGVTGVLVRHADDVFAELTERQRVDMRRLFVQLSRPGAGDPFLRRPSRATALAPELTDTARTLAHRRLVVLSRAAGDAAQEEMVDLAHEALTRLWHTGRQWLVESHDHRLWQETLRADLIRWESQHRDPGRLLRGADLAEAELRMASNPDDISNDERAYILLSHQWRRRARLKQAAIGALAVLVVLAAVLTLSI
ncbi:caspase, EACC1-associated type [Streptomyces sp. NPDC002206]